MMEPQVLLFDEPTAALDPEITAQIVSIIRELAETNITQVIDRIELPASWHNDAMTHRYLRKMESSPFINHLVDGTLPLIWAKTRLLSDDPAKGEGKAKRHSLLPQRLFDIMGSPSERIDIISSYFVPTRAGVAQLLRMVRKGVKIAINYTRYTSRQL